MTIAPPPDLTEIDIATVDRLAAHLAQAIASGDGDVVVDLASVTFLDTAGLGVLATALGHLNGTGRQLVVVGARPGVARVLSLTGLGRLASARG